eukprot:1030245-Rhodomonas_salina.4
MSCRSTRPRQLRQTRPQTILFGRMHHAQVQNVPLVHERRAGGCRCSRASAAFVSSHNQVSAINIDRTSPLERSQSWRRLRRTARCRAECLTPQTPIDGCPGSIDVVTPRPVNSLDEPPVIGRVAASVAAVWPQVGVTRRGAVGAVAVMHVHVSVPSAANDEGVDVQRHAEAVHEVVDKGRQRNPLQHPPRVGAALVPIPDVHGLVAC